MRRWIRLAPAVVAAVFAVAGVARACSLCGGSLQRQSTLREEARFAKIVVIGALSEPRLVPGEGGLNQGGATDVTVGTILKGAEELAGRDVITVPRFIPVDDPKNPPTFLVFCDVFQGKIDPYRGLPIRGDGLAAYLRGALGHAEDTDPDALAYFFEYLDSDNPAVASDAFLEFAKATDAAVGRVAKRLDPQRLRRLLATAPPERLGVIAFLLGACGTDADAELLASMIAENGERSRAALGGLLGGYIALEPEAGWQLLNRLLADPARSFNEKLSVLNTLRFFKGWKPDEYREEILTAVERVVRDGDLADLAIEDLRRWHWWDLTGAVLEQYGKESHSAPIVRRAIIRYALSCPEAAAGEFVSKVRSEDAETVRDLEEAIAFERSGK